MTGSTQEYLSSIQPGAYVDRIDPDSGELDPHAIGDAIKRIALREDIAPALLDESATKGLDGPELTALGQLGIYEPRHN